MLIYNVYLLWAWLVRLEGASDAKAAVLYTGRKSSEGLFEEAANRLII